MKKKYSIKTKYGTFQVLIWHDKRDKVYLAQIPSFDNAMTQGSNMTDAKEMAIDLIKLLSEDALSEGRAIIDSERTIYAKGKLARQTGPVMVTA